MLSRSLQCKWDSSLLSMEHTFVCEYSPRIISRRLQKSARTVDPPWWVWPFLIVPAIVGSLFLTYAVVFTIAGIVFVFLSEYYWAALALLGAAVCGVWAWREGRDEPYG